MEVHKLLEVKQAEEQPADGGTTKMLEVGKQAAGRYNRMMAGQQGDVVGAQVLEATTGLMEDNRRRRYYNRPMDGTTGCWSHNKLMEDNKLRRYNQLIGGMMERSLQQVTGGTTGWSWRYYQLMEGATALDGWYNSSGGSGYNQVIGRYKGDGVTKG
eukprot:gene32049-16583_t